MDYASNWNYSWRIATSEFLVFVGISFVSVLKNNVLLPKKAVLKTVSNLYGVLTPLSNCLVGVFEEFGFFEIVKGATIDLAMAYLAFRRSLKMDLGGHVSDNVKSARALWLKLRGGVRLPDELVYEQKQDVHWQIVYDKNLLGPVAVECKAGFWRYSLDDAVVWGSRASIRESLVQSKVDVEQAAIFDQLSPDLGDDWEEGDWYLTRTVIPVPYVCLNEQQDLFRRNFESGLKNRPDGSQRWSGLLKVVEDWCLLYAILDRLECEAVYMRSKTGEQADTVDGLQNTKEDPELEIGSVRLTFRCWRKQLVHWGMTQRRQLQTWCRLQKVMPRVLWIRPS